MAGVVYRFRARKVDVTPLRNGNYLVADGDKVEVMLPEEFHAVFEAVLDDDVIEPGTCQACGQKLPVPNA